MHALVDCDILCYEMGSAVDPEGFPLDWPIVKARVDARINQILHATQATMYTAYLTSQDKTNFRFKIASIKGYKENRTNKKKPHWYQDVYDYIANKPNAVIVYGQEADDAMSITQWSNLRDAVNNHGASRVKAVADTVICTRDKDLRMVPGWHYQWAGYNQEEKDPYWITPHEGKMWFYSQLMMGDSADNIPGLYGVGKTSNYIKRLSEKETELEMFNSVKTLYKAYFGNYWKFFLTENARLLWMRTREGEMWEFPEGWDEHEEKEAQPKEVQERAGE